MGRGFSMAKATPLFAVQMQQLQLAYKRVAIE